MKLNEHYYAGNTYQQPNASPPVVHATTHMYELLAPENFEHVFKGLVKAIDASGLRPSSFAIAGTSGAMLGGALSRHYKKPLFVVHQQATTSTQAGVQGYYGIDNYVIVDDIMFSKRTAKNIEQAMRARFPECKLSGVFLYLESADLGRTTELNGARVPLFQTFEPKVESLDI